MSFRRSAKLGLAGRYARVSAPRHQPRTAGGTVRRTRSEETRMTLACLLDRSSRSLRSPRQLADAICACRRETGWGPRLVERAASTSQFVKLVTTQQRLPLLEANVCRI